MKKYQCTRKEPGQGFIKPGFGFIPNANTRLWTVVGSGIAVTLYDQRNRIGGMAHYTRPYRTPGGPSTAQFAAPCIIWLLRQLMGRGARKEDIEAQIFGGACRRDQPGYISEIHTQNAHVGLEILRKEGIKVTGVDVGGQRGRKVLFNTDTGESASMRIDNIRGADWYPRLN